MAGVRFLHRCRLCDLASGKWNLEAGCQVGEAGMTRCFQLGDLTCVGRGAFYAPLPPL